MCLPRLGAPSLESSSQSRQKIPGKVTGQTGSFACAVDPNPPPASLRELPFGFRARGLLEISGLLSIPAEGKLVFPYEEAETSTREQLSNLPSRRPANLITFRTLPDYRPPEFPL